MKQQAYRDVDESLVVHMMRDTGLLSSKPPEDWNWPVILDWLTGPARHRARLQDPLCERLMRRLLLFYTPSATQYSATPLPGTVCVGVWVPVYVPILGRV